MCNWENANDVGLGVETVVWVVVWGVVAFSVIVVVIIVPVFASVVVVLPAFSVDNVAVVACVLVTVLGYRCSRSLPILRKDACKPVFNISTTSET